MNVGKSLRIAIAKSGMKQTEVAKLSDISYSYVSLIANEKQLPALEVLERISKDVFGMKVSEFIALGE